MPTQNTEIINQLNTLLRLTTHEAATARVRVAQATTDDTRKELTQNAANSDKRADSIRKAVIDLGGAPDVVGLALGKATAAAKLPLEQTMPIVEALLADLALEHQLFDRSRLIKVLALDAEFTEIVRLAERLEVAHGNTIQWLFTVLSETAIGGPAALAPTPIQAAASSARTAATFGSSAAAVGLNKAVVTAGQLGKRVQRTATDGVERLTSLAGSARKIAKVGRDATLAETEKQTAKEFGKGAAGSVHSLREGLGAVSASELPIKNFDNLTQKDAATAIGRLTSAEDVQVVLAYEGAHKNRSTVIDLATKHVTQIAEDLINT